MPHGLEFVMTILVSSANKTGLRVDVSDVLLERLSRYKRKNKGPHIEPLRNPLSLAPIQKNIYFSVLTKTP
jgi:hypothetical protein